MSSEGDPKFYAEDEVERYIEELYLDEKDLETEFTECTKDSKSCQPPCDEQLPILRQKVLNNRLIQHYLQYQQKEFLDYIEGLIFKILT